MEFYEESKARWRVICTILCFAVALKIYTEAKIHFGFSLDWFLEFIILMMFYALIGSVFSRIAYISKQTKWFVYKNDRVRIADSGWQWIKPRTTFCIPRQEFYLKFPIVFTPISKFNWEIKIRLDNADLTSINAFVCWVHKLLSIYYEGLNSKLGDLRLQVSIEIDNAVRNPDPRFTVLERVNH
ncbi:MAG: hypothetical protein AAB766_04310 [Patescibacteria group bacterium]